MKLPSGPRIQPTDRDDRQRTTKRPHLRQNQLMFVLGFALAVMSISAGAPSASQNDPKAAAQLHAVQYGAVKYGALTATTTSEDEITDVAYTDWKHGGLLTSQPFVAA